MNSFIISHKYLAFYNLVIHREVSTIHYHFSLFCTYDHEYEV